MPTWPVTLPQSPLVGTWTESPMSNTIEVQPDVGAGISRRRSTATFYNGAGEWLLITNAQLEDFWEFYLDDCLDGSISFAMPHPVTGVSKNWKFDKSSGPPSVTSMGIGFHRVSLNLIRLPG